mgnify:CR=1 FL=1
MPIKSNTQKELPNKVKENEAGSVGLNPNMNVQSMGNATLPGNPGSANSFSSHKTNTINCYAGIA